jgi:pimeloyl-ACP methyl ester carboxylesterase
MEGRKFTRDSPATSGTGSGTGGATPPNAIVLIHGLWMTPLCWEGWIHRYEGRGHRVLAPTWPGMDVDIDEFRRDPSAVAGLGITEIVDHYDAIIRELERPPIMMGHSFGGGFVQILLDRGLGAAGVAIHPAPVKGVLRLPLSALRAAFPVLGNPANRKRAVPLTPKQFHYAFTNTLTEEDSQAVYERLHVPGPGRVLFQAATANLNPNAATKVNLHNDDRAPLLVIGGDKDHTVPASLSREVAQRQGKSKAVTDYREFPGRSHYTLGQDGWEEVADHALDWATNLDRAEQGAAAAPAG